MAFHSVTAHCSLSTFAFSILPLSLSSSFLSFFLLCLSHSLFSSFFFVFFFLKMVFLFTFSATLFYFLSFLFLLLFLLDFLIYSFPLRLSFFSSSPFFSSLSLYLSLFHLLRPSRLLMLVLKSWLREQHLGIFSTSCCAYVCVCMLTHYGMSYVFIVTYISQLFSQ